MNRLLGPGLALLALLPLTVNRYPTITSQHILPDSTAPSSWWPGALPDGETKRRFILDCTGCHQFDGRIALKDGRPKTAPEFEEAIQRMLRFAGANSAFPVIADGRDPATTAHWLTDAPHSDRRPRWSPPKSLAQATITEYNMPMPQDLPHDLAVEADGHVVITGMFSHVMYRLDPATGAMERIEIPLERSGPRAVELDPAGNWWILLGGPEEIARYRPASRTWDTWPIGMYPHSIGLDRTGQIWFNGHFTRTPELIGSLDPASGSVTNHEVPAHPMSARPGGPIPYELRAAPNGVIWMSELQGNRLASFTPEQKSFAVHEMPTTYSGPRRFDIDSSGLLWIPAYSANRLVRFDPSASTFREFTLPIADAVPYVVRVDQETGVLWIGTSAADAVLSFDPRSERFTVYPLPSRGALVRHITIDPRTHDVWLAYGASPGPLSARVARLSLRP